MSQRQCKTLILFEFSIREKSKFGSVYLKQKLFFYWSSLLLQKVCNIAKKKSFSSYFTMRRVNCFYLVFMQFSPCHAPSKVAQANRHKTVTDRNPCKFLHFFFCKLTGLPIPYEKGEDFANLLRHCKTEWLAKRSWDVLRVRNFRKSLNCSSFNRLHVSYGERIETRYLSKDGYFYGIPFFRRFNGERDGRRILFWRICEKGCNKRVFSFANFSSTVRQSHGGVTGKFEGFIVLLKWVAIFVLNFGKVIFI